MRTRHAIAGLIAVLLPTSVACVEQEAGDPPANGAQAYYEWMLSAIDKIDKDMPAITSSAEAAARLYVEHDYVIESYGDHGVVGEACGRAGGIMRMGSGGHFLAGRDSVIVLVSLRSDAMDRITDALGQAPDRAERYVVLLGQPDLIEPVKAAGIRVDAAHANHAAAHEGLFRTADGAHRVPTSPVTSTILMWTWTGEFVAACTRLGKMPVMYQAHAVEGGEERSHRLRELRFHPEKPQPVDAGKAGHEYLAELRIDLQKVHDGELADIGAAAALAVEALRADRGVYAFLHGHLMLHDQVEYPTSTGYFTQYNDGWFGPKEGVELQPEDVVLCIGFDRRYHTWQFNEWDDGARAQGAILIWSFTDYKTEETRGVAELGELYINQHWDYGDAVVLIPGYDVKILPTSGVIGQALFRMINAEMLATLDPSATPGK